MGGGAGPFLVGGVICLVNSANKRDLNPARGANNMNNIIHHNDNNNNNNSNNMINHEY